MAICRKEYSWKGEKMIHLLCPYCYNAFDIQAYASTDVSYGITCDSCGEKFFTRAVMLSNSTLEGLNDSIVHFCNQGKLPGAGLKSLEAGEED